MKAKTSSKAAHKAEGALDTMREHPGYLMMRSVSRFESVRGAMVALQKAWRPSVHRYLHTLAARHSRFFNAVDSAAIASGVDRDGFAFGLTLPADTVAQLMQFARTHRCFVDRNPELGFMPGEVEQARAKLGRNFLLAQYFNLRDEAPLIAELARDPVLLSIAARYLESPPTLVGVNLFWSYPATVSAEQHSYAAQMFHYDLDDFKFLKFFFYLTDVDETSGPHVIVRASHRSKRHSSFAERLKVRRYSDDEIRATYGAENIVTIMGPAGTGFAEDTLCIHKGQSPVTRERLILQFQYAFNDWGIQHDDRDPSRLKMI
jgi:hypothetical protein